MIHLDNVTKNYPGVQAVCNVSLKVDEGETLFLSAPAAAGRRLRSK